MSLSNIEPQIIWKNFSKLNAVPRPSKKEARVIEFIKNFGESLSLDTQVDEIGNVIIRKPATAGMENRKTIVLQAHLDMVCQKNNDVDFDFENQGIQMFVDGDWVKAKGTTLGADNGLGVAAVMSILESSDIAHPALEALFTIDEETGMTGAFNLKPNVLKGEILLNLDTEEDDEIDIGCAGGVDVTATQTYKTAPTKGNLVKIEIKGLQGGHSGMDIHKGFGNANVLLGRLLYNSVESQEIELISIDGGGLRNAIPREATAVFSVKNADEFITEANELKADELKALGVPFGPVFGRLKRGEVVTLEDGRVIDGKDYVSEDIKGRVVVICGDTRFTPKSITLAQNANVLVHEATYEADKEKTARQHFHSTSKQAATIALEANVQQLYLTHISARYLGHQVSQLEQEARKVFPQTKVVKDFDTFTIGRN